MEVHVTIRDPGTLALDLLHEETELAKQRIKWAMQRGAVWVTRGRNTQRLRRAKRRLKAGDQIHLYYDESILAEEPAVPELVADLGEYSVWNKPKGLRSQGSKWGDHCTVYRWAEQNMQPERPAFIVHRLDRAASGLILTAHTKHMAAQLSKRFSDRVIEKTYRAIVRGDLSAQLTPLRVDTPLDDKDAVSEITFRTMRKTTADSVVDVSIETGRKHQIRRHLASIGHPIIGDRLYGSGVSDGVDLCLVAFYLRFECPVQRKTVEYHVDPHQTS